MNKKIIYSILILLSFCFIGNVNAESVFDTLEDKYYIVHKWVGNNSSIGNNAYYVGIFNNYPIIENETIYDSSENITYYKISTEYNLLKFIDTGDTSLVDTTTTTKNLMQLNSDSSNMIYSNFDIYIDNNLYFAKNEYSSALWLEGTWGSEYQVIYHESINKLRTSTTLISLEEYPYALASTKWNGILYISTKPFYYSEEKGYYTLGTSRSYTFNESYGSDSSYVSMYYFDEGIASANHNIINTDNNSYKVYAADVFNVAPTIEITKTNETIKTFKEQNYITDVTVNIEFSSVDNDSYLYMYKYGSDSEWSTITLTQSNSFSKTYSENNTLYVQVLDKSDNSVVTSSTYTINTIQSLPDNYLEDNLTEDTINSEFNLRDVIFHKCQLSLEVGYVLCEIEINNFDNTIYNYYHRIGNKSYTRFYPDEKTQVLPEVYDDSLFINTLDDISLYQKWQSATDDTKTYILSLKIYENTTITILRENKETGEKQYYTFTTTSFADNSDMSQIEQFIYDHLFSKFYFIYQFKQIIEYVSAYDFEENVKAPQFTFNLGFIGLDPVTVDMEIDEHSRLLIQGYIKLFASIAVVYTFIKETAKLFNH